MIILPLQPFISPSSCEQLGVSPRFSDLLLVTPFLSLASLVNVLFRVLASSISCLPSSGSGRTSALSPVYIPLRHGLKTSAECSKMPTNTLLVL